jgi:beta-lactamase regulating signal transducer with metallopeptidase domain
MERIASMHDWSAHIAEIGTLAPSLAMAALRALALVTVAFGLAHVLRRRSAAARVALWRGTFVGLVLLPFSAAWLPTVPLFSAHAERPLSSAPTAVDGITRADVEPALLALAESRAVSTPEADTLAGDARLVTNDAASPEVEHRAQSSDLLARTVASLPSAFVALWLALAALLLAKQARAAAQAVRLVRGATDAPQAVVAEVRGALVAAGAGARGVRTRVLLSDAPCAPFVWDPWPLGRAALVLPAQEADGRVAREVVLHETAHIARRDGAWLVWTRCVAAFYAPLVPIARAARRLYEESERAADDSVLRAGARPSVYAALLVDMAQRSAPAPAALATMAARDGQALEARVRAVLAPHMSRAACSGRSRVTSVAAALVATVALGSLGMAPATQQRTAPPPTALQPAAHGRLGDVTPSAQESRDSGAAQAKVADTATADQEAARVALWMRGLGALVAEQDAETGAWRGHVGFKLNNDWRVTAANVPHVGVTGLAVEALVLAGARPGEGPLGVALQRGVDFLLANQTGAGHFMAHGSRMREHAHALQGLASLVLAEHRCGAVVSEGLLEAVRRGLQFTVEAQNEDGGWRFQPRTLESDVVESAVQSAALIRAATANVLDLQTPRGVEGNGYNDEHVLPARRRALTHVLAHRVPAEGRRIPAGFRFQIAEHARVTARTTGAGLLGMAVLAGDDYEPDQTERWQHSYETFRQLREGWDTDTYARHFLLWEADWFTTTALEDFARHGVPEGMTLRDTWRGEELARLTELEEPKGGWRCDVGPGSSYFTALGCLRLGAMAR